MRTPTLYVVSIPGTVGRALLLDDTRREGRYFVRMEDANDWAKVNAPKGWSIVAMRVALPLNERDARPSLSPAAVAEDPMD